MMTEEEIRAATPEELRVMVAETLGWRRDLEGEGRMAAQGETVAVWLMPEFDATAPDRRWTKVYPVTQNDSYYPYPGIWKSWSTNIVAALELTAGFDGFTLDRADDRNPIRRWHCGLMKMSTGAWNASADTAPVAIVRAVLLAGLEE